MTSRRLVPLADLDARWGVVPPRVCTDERAIDPPVTRWDARRLAFYAAPTIAWYPGNPAPAVYSATGGTLDIGVAMNNAWYAATVGDRALVVYAEETSPRRVNVVGRSIGSPSSSATWSLTHTTTAGSAEAATSDGTEYNSVGYPCIAAKRHPSGRLAVAVAWVGDGAGAAAELWASYRGPDPAGTAWAEVDVAALGGLLRPLRPCLTMDTACNAWLVFAAVDAAGDQNIYLSVRPANGDWSIPTQVSTPDDYVDGARTLTYESADFASIAVSGAADPKGPTVTVVWRVDYGPGTQKRVLGKSMRVANVRTAGLDISGAPEVDLGGSTECRDPCVVATDNGVFLVFYSAPNTDSSVCSRYNSDPVTNAWSSEVQVAPFTKRYVQNFANACIDEASGLCLVVWEETEGGADPQTPFGAYCALATLGTWTPLGNLTDLTAYLAGEEGSFPCVVTSGGAPRLLYITPGAKGIGELHWRPGAWR